MDTEENSLFEKIEGRKRDHKIWITDEAIAKVPFIKYKSIPEKHYHTIQQIAKKVLSISKEQNNSNEVAIVYSLDWERLAKEGKMYLGVSLGDEHSVDPTENPTAYHLVRNSVNCVVICMHNHPNLSKLSLDDVQFFLRRESVKMLAAVTNLGSISYIVKPDNFDWDAAISVYNEAVSIYKLKPNDLKTAQKAADYFLNNCKKANIIYDDR